MWVRRLLFYSERSGDTDIGKIIATFNNKTGFDLLWNAYTKQVDKMLLPTSLERRCNIYSSKAFKSVRTAMPLSIYDMQVSTGCLYIYIPPSFNEVNINKWASGYVEMTKVGDFWYTRQINRFNSYYLINTLEIVYHLIGGLRWRFLSPLPLPSSRPHWFWLWWIL